MWCGRSRDSKCAADWSADKRGCLPLTGCATWRSEKANNKGVSSMAVGIGDRVRCVLAAGIAAGWLNYMSVGNMSVGKRQDNKCKTD